MVKRYIILADSCTGFNKPRQLTIVNGEPLIKRTIRLLKENGINDIIITSHEKRFDNLGAVRYEPKYNDYDAEKQTGYWLSAFPIELLNEPITFLFGDVYYSKNAIKKIVETDPKDILFFCTYNNKNEKYIKEHDEPLAFKVKDYKLFKKHIDIVKKMKDDGLCCREPITWELYRSINNQDINEHKMTKNYIVINDESCDIDTIQDIYRLENVIGGGKMIKCEAIQKFTLKRFKELRNIVRANENDNKKGELYKGDIFECNSEIADYLTGNNDKGLVVVKIVELEPVKNDKKSDKKVNKKNNKKASKK